MTMVDFGKVAIGVRSGKFPDPCFALDSLARLLIEGTRAGDVYLRPSIGAPHALACNLLVDQFMATDCGALLFLDDDMAFPPHMLERLRSTPGEADVVSGLCCCRRGALLPVALIGSTVIKRFNRPVHYVSAVGLAFTIVSRSAITAVQGRRGAEPFMWTNERGEDGEFCADVAGAGLKIAINPDVVIDHRLSGSVRWDETRQASSLSLDNVIHATATATQKEQGA